MLFEEFDASFQKDQSLEVSQEGSTHFTFTILFFRIKA